MKFHSCLAASAAILCQVLAQAALASPALLPRYQVAEIHVPPDMRTGCVPELTRSVTSAGINDFGIVSANFGCYSQFEPSGPQASVAEAYGTFVGATWFASYELPSAGGSAFSSEINNLGQVFGVDFPANGLVGARWSLTGSQQNVFDAPECEFLNFSGATGGNARYVVGWGLRGDPEQAPPLDTLCITNFWLIRQPDGKVELGPRGEGHDINLRNVAVGMSDFNAIRLNVPTGEIRVLHGGGSDAARGSIASGINDLNEAAGYSYEYYTEGTVTCTRNTALRWDRQGRETRLPHLPGAVSSRAVDVGYHGEVVGDSGPGNRCPFVGDQDERATLWQGTRAIDLNRTIPANLRITLIYANGINRRGQIVATGFVNDEPLASCPHFTWNSETLENELELLPCRNLRVYVLTPR